MDQDQVNIHKEVKLIFGSNFWLNFDPARLVL